MEIRVVSTDYSDVFEKEVNKLLKEGWELHGESVTSVTSHQDTWDGALRSYRKYNFTQILKRLSQIETEFTVK